MVTFDLFAQEPQNDQTLSAEDSPVSHSVTPGSDVARTTTAISGRKCAALLASSDPLGSLVRTLLESSAWNSTRCYLTWKHSATPQGRLLFRLLPSMPRTAGIGSGSLLATATATANQLCPSMQKHPGCRALWPTPDASVMQDGEQPATWLARRERIKAEKKNGNGMGTPLAMAVKLWPTARSNGASNAGGSNSRARAKRDGQYISGSLNPTWVEWLMGYPLGWTALDASATPSSRKSRK